MTGINASWQVFSVLIMSPASRALFLGLVTAGAVGYGYIVGCADWVAFWAWVNIRPTGEPAGCVSMSSLSLIQTSAQLTRQLSHVRVFDDVEVGAGDLVYLYAPAGQLAPSFDKIN